MTQNQKKYSQLVTRIRKIDAGVTDSYFEIGKWADEAMTYAASFRTLARDTGIPRTTLTRYRDAWRYWGDRRIPGSPAFYYYAMAAEINDPALRRALLRQGVGPHRHRFARHMARSAPSTQHRIERGLAEAMSAVGSGSLTVKEARAMVREIDRLRDAVLNSAVARRAA